MHRLNNPKIQPLTRSLALQLGLDPAFVEFVFATERPSSFDYWCEDLAGSWTAFVPDHVTVAYPLWATGADQTLLLVSGSSVSYGKGYHDGTPDVERISQTSQGLLATLLMQIWESGATADEMRDAAQFCGFHFWRDLVEFLDATASLDSQLWSKQEQTFIAEIDAKYRMLNT
jgi:hypothetical protein